MSQIMTMNRGVDFLKEIYEPSTQGSTNVLSLCEEFPKIFTAE